MLCALGNNTGNCFGDSGSPVLYVGDTFLDDVQVGIVSGGSDPCADNDFPSFSSRTSAGFDWIRAQTCSLAPHPPAYMECNCLVSFASCSTSLECCSGRCAMSSCRISTTNRERPRLSDVQGLGGAGARGTGG
jgi:hypothetical protein